MSTVTVPVSELTRPALNWAVAKCEGHGEEWLERWNDASDRRFTYCQVIYDYSSNWSQGGRIIDREFICVFVRPDCWPDSQRWSARPNTPDGVASLAPTALIAAMRCHVTSKLGSAVEVPAELMI